MQIGQLNMSQDEEWKIIITILAVQIFHDPGLFCRVGGGGGEMPR